MANLCKGGSERRGTQMSYSNYFNEIESEIEREYKSDLVVESHFI